MERSISDINILNKFVTKFCEIVDKHTKYIIVSGFIAIATGRVRGTEDIDMIISVVDIERFKQFHEDLIKNDFICMQSDDVNIIFEYLEEQASVRYTYKDSPLPEMKIKFAKDKLDEVQVKERVKIPITGLDVFFGSIEYNIAFKEEYLKSDKDLEDARHLRIIFDEEINENKINTIKETIKELRL